MADETYSIDIDVDSKDVKKANKELARLQKHTDRLRKSQRRLAAQTKRSTVRVQNMGRQMRSLGRSTQRMNNRTAIMNARFKEANKFRSPFEGLGGALGGVAKNVSGIAAAAAIATTAISVLATVGFTRAVIGAKDFGNNTMIAFEALTGSSQKAFSLMERSKGLADEFGQTIQGVTGQFKKLLAAQFSIEQSETFIKLGADLRAIGTDAEGVKSAIRAITQIKAKGRLQADELLQLSEANISQELIFKELQKSLGVGDIDAVRKAIEAGEVKSAQALEAIQGAILKKTGSQEAGEAGAKFADKSIEAMQNRIANSGFSLLGAVADASPEAFTKLAAIGKDVSRFFDQLGDTKQGESLATIFTTAVDALGALVKIGKAFFSGFVDRFAEGGDDISRFTRTLTDPAVLASFQEWGDLLAGVAANIIEAGLAFTQFLTSFQVARAGVEEEFMKMESLFNTFGFNIAQGVADGIESGISSVINAASNIANAAKNQFKSVLGIASPSKVFEGFGTNVVEGFDKGVQTPAVKAAASGGGASASGGASVGTTNNFNLGGMSVNNEINEASDGEAVAAQVASSAMGMVGSAFEKMALANGVA